MMSKRNRRDLKSILIQFGNQAYFLVPRVILQHFEAQKKNRELLETKALLFDKRSFDSRDLFHCNANRTTFAWKIYDEFPRILRVFSSDGENKRKKLFLDTNV